MALRLNNFDFEISIFYGKVQRTKKYRLLRVCDILVICIAPPIMARRGHNFTRADFSTDFNNPLKSTFPGFIRDFYYFSVFFYLKKVDIK